jgi:hypothetical protein
LYPESKRVSGGKVKEINSKNDSVMKTLIELKAFCEKNNVRYELHKKMNRARFPWENEENDERYQVGWSFGMNNIAGRSGKSEWNWTWFESYGEELNNETVFFFAERYSQLNGKSNTGLRELIQAEETIERRMRN